MKIRWSSSTTPPPKMPIGSQASRFLGSLKKVKSTVRSSPSGEHRAHDRAECNIQRDEHHQTEEQTHAEMLRPFLSTQA